MKLANTNFFTLIIYPDFYNLENDYTVSTSVKKDLLFLKSEAESLEKSEKNVKVQLKYLMTKPVLDSGFIIYHMALRTAVPDRILIDKYRYQCGPEWTAFELW
jgi:hypothetical protein